MKHQDTDTLERVISERARITRRFKSPFYDEEDGADVHYTVTPSNPIRDAGFGHFGDQPH